ncbi:MAG TPA: ammonium transporter [Pirellulales bacterium]|nr:ammonium transporter [Pirellulales bacterium]
MSVRRLLGAVLCALAGVLVFAGPLWADDAAPSSPPAIDRGDHAWMLVSCALVLMMTAPGLAMFYGGLVRKKNVLGVMMQCFFLMGLNTVLWAVYGYSLAFGGDPASEDFNRWIGNGEYLCMQNVQPTSPTNYPLEKTPDGTYIPRLTHMLFQGMFFIITPALICGAFAERMKFSTMVVFMVLWGLLIYCPLCHWVWDGGVLAFGSPHSKLGGVDFGALDFAGGTVVHISSGITALVCALVMGRRLGYGHQPMPPHNLTYTIIGAALLWVGWFGFNAGSALCAGAQAASAFAATHFAAAAGAVAWAVAEWVVRGKPTVLGTCSGAVAGLVCITPASGYVLPMPALAMGALAGFACCGSCLWLKAKLGYDDSLDAFGVHGVGGTLGSVLTGVFATQAIYGAEPLGLLERGSLFKGQIAATALTWVFSAAVSFALLKVLDATMGLRVSQQQEIQGLDVSQHGEEGYIFI